MSLDTTQIQTIRSQTLAQIEQLTLNPKPSYSIDGQQVAWREHLDSLQRSVDWCDRKLAECDPFEIQSEGGS